MAHYHCGIRLLQSQLRTLHISSFLQSGVVPFLLETVGSSDKELQEASAGCLQNIRELALRAEEFLSKGH